MTDLVICQKVHMAGTHDDVRDKVVLTYEDRFLRRRVMHTVRDDSFLLDLDQTTSLNQGDVLELHDGRLIEVIAAKEDLFEVTGSPLHRIAWHIGNRHTPCQIEADRLLIQRDHVIRDMLQKIGASVREVVEPFTPEGGAYGHGRTHRHGY